MLNGLDLFSGIGGISIALSPWVRTIAYCEQDRYAQSVLLSRMSEGKLHRAPIWDDVQTLTGEMLPTIDIIFGGFPCQDISVAGRGEGLGGERSGLFYEIIRLTKETRTPFVFLENVPAIRTRGLREVARAFTEIGYDCRWTCLSAASVGAPHKRERWFLLAHANSSDLRVKQGWSGRENRQREVELRDDGSEESLADSNSIGLSQERTKLETTRASRNSDETSSEWWAVEPAVGRTIDGLSRKLDGDLYGIFDIEAEKRASEVLSDLSQRNIAEAVQRKTRGLDRISAEEILLSIVREYEAGNRLSRNVLASKTTSKGSLRTLQYEGRASRAPLRRGSVEQYFREHPNALRIMSQLVASRGETPWSNPLWEGAVPRVMTGVPLRPHRIKCLGNSVVPKQVREAFKILSGLKEGE